MNEQKGFSIIELLIALAIFAIHRLKAITRSVLPTQLQLASF